MKTLALFLFAPLAGLFFTACGGPGNAELRAELRDELQQVEAEMTQLYWAAESLKSQMGQAQWQQLFGGFAATYGTFDGNGQLALQGTGVAVEGIGTYDRANMNLQQVQQRFWALDTRRNEILSQLR